MVGRLTGRPLHGFIALLYEHPPKKNGLAFLRVKKKNELYFISFYFIFPLLPEIFRSECFQRKNYFFLRFSPGIFIKFLLYSNMISMVSEFHGSIFINFHDPLSMNNVIDVSIISYSIKFITISYQLIQQYGNQINQRFVYFLILTCER